MTAWLTLEQGPLEVHQVELVVRDGGVVFAIAGEGTHPLAGRELRVASCEKR